MAAVTLGSCTPQSNYAIQGIDQEYTEGLPPKATLDGKVTELDTLQPTIKLNRTQAVLNCAAGSMHVELQFKEPFYGIAYSDFDRNSACYARGNGLPTVTLELPLKGCGTRQVSFSIYLPYTLYSPCVQVRAALELSYEFLLTHKNYPLAHCPVTDAVHFWRHHVFKYAQLILHICYIKSAVFPFCDSRNYYCCSKTTLTSSLLLHCSAHPRPHNKRECYNKCMVVSVDFLHGKLR